MVSNVIGLTGLIGSGKSLVATYFSELGIEIIDTDIISHDLTVEGGQAIPDIKNKFGDSFITANYALDRDKMRNLVFKDSAAKNSLEQILHPLIYDEVLYKLNKSISKYVIIVVPLLFNSKKYLKIIKRSIFVDCKEEIIIKRVVERSGIDLEILKSILASQMPRELQMAMATDLIANNGDKNNLKEQVYSFYLLYNKLYG